MIGKSPGYFFRAYTLLPVVPLGLMRKTPTGLPDYMVKTRAGFAIARQLARHFDPTGMTYGITLTSTSKSSYTEFVETMKTLMDYSSPRIFNDKNISFALNGSLSINERIVDNTAFRIIYDSVNFAPDADLLPWISSDYAREKVFFIAIAQGDLVGFLISVITSNFQKCARRPLCWTSCCKFLKSAICRRCYVLKTS